MSVAVAPGLRVIGNAGLRTEKPVPVVEAADMVTAVVPVDDIVTVSVVGDPIVTVPKLKEVALSERTGWAAAVPVPESVTVVVAPVDELLVIVSLPVSVAAVVGAKVICSVRD